jgi:uncharacterized membrane protein YraQ (UPF0718 family)
MQHFAPLIKNLGDCLAPWTMTTSQLPTRLTTSRTSPWLIPALAAVLLLWLLAYVSIQPIADWLAYRAIGLSPDSHLGQSLAFFFYDVPKILLLLSGMIFLISIVRTFFSPERTRLLLGGKREGVGNVLGALLGVATPFCSCSAVPLFIGFVEAGIPLGVTFSFLIAAPIINEIAIVMLLGLFGWQVATLYVLSGLVIAILAGLLIGRLHMQRFVEDFVWQIQGSGQAPTERLTWMDRIQRARTSVSQIVGKVWIYVVIAIAVGAGIHGYVPEDALAGVMGAHAWWSVPLAVLMGIPLYSNAAGMIPIVAAIIEKGASLGTALAFMMSVVGLSLPEAIILRRVLKLPLLVAFFCIIGLGMILIGLLFNAVL